MLPELQKQFLDGLLRENTLIFEQLDSSIRDAQQQLNIYRYSYQGGLLKAMQDIYPVTVRLLGSEFFDAMCMQYIKQTPCQSFDINQYSESFSEFADQFSPLRELVYIPDVIRLEWAWHRAYQSPDFTGQDFTPLLSFDSTQLESISLNLIPSITLLSSSYPVDLIWIANQDNQGNNKNVELENKLRYLIIWRNGLDSHVDVLKPDLFAFLLSIQNNLSIAAIMKNIPDVEQHIMFCLQHGYFGSYQTQNSLDKS